MEVGPHQTKIMAEIKKKATKEIKSIKSAMTAALQSQDGTKASEVIGGL